MATEFSWLVENGKQAGRGLEYRSMDESGIHWTADPQKAIRFSRRADAEMFAAGDEDAWRIVQHGFEVGDGDCTCGSWLCDKCSPGRSAHPRDARRKAPWADFAGSPIFEGDTLVHPDGQKGRALFVEGYGAPEDAWRIDYGDGTPSRLCLQIGDKGRARVAQNGRAE